MASFHQTQFLEDGFLVSLPVHITSDYIQVVEQLQTWYLLSYR